MASSTIGQLAWCFSGPGNTTRVPPMNTNPTGRTGNWGARLFGTQIDASGTTTVYGTVNSAGAPASRRIVIMTQPPKPKVIYEACTSVAVNSYTFSWLPAGTYTVMDFDAKTNLRALVYDLVVSG